jgi:hypothetical protein
VNAAADYAAAVAQLNRALPAYVSYVDHTSGGWGPFHGDSSQVIVVHVPDGRVVKGRPGGVHIGINTSSFEDNVVTHPPFEPTCYVPDAAGSATFDGRPVERIAVHDRCDRTDKDAAFNALYVDPVTREPLAAAGGSDDDRVAVRIEQRFAPFAGHIMPASIDVSVKGHGLMSWLDVSARIRYTDYRFSASAL